MRFFGLTDDQCISFSNVFEQGAEHYLSVEILVRLLVPIRKMKPRNAGHLFLVLLVRPIIVPHPSNGAALGFLG
jgi:hypothetical protein